ncbi:MAG: type II toxin-antitoxin system VapC family toxin, partial [Actinomycetes bacterium]
RDPRPKIARLLQEYAVTVVPFSDAHWVESTEAFLADGKGRHRAALNYGDCLTCAVAKLSGEALLATGGDFTGADLEVVAL